MKYLLLFLVFACSAFADYPPGYSAADFEIGGTFHGRVALKNKGKFPSTVVVTRLNAAIVDQEDEPDYAYTYRVTMTTHETVYVPAGATVNYNYDGPEYGDSSVGRTFRFSLLNAGYVEGQSIISDDSTTPVPFGSETHSTTVPTRSTIEFLGRGIIDDAEKPIWTGNTTKTTPLTADVFREGIDKLLVYGVGSGGSSEAGGGTRETTHIEAVATDMQSLRDSKPSDVTIAESSATGRNLLSAAMSNSTVSFVSGNHTATGGSLSDSAWRVSIPLSRRPAEGLEAFELNLNPLANADVAAIAAWFKTIVTCLVFIIFEAWVWRQFTEHFQNTLLTPQNHGNAVLGGTGGQGTSVVATAIIGIIILGLPALAWAVYSGGLAALGGPTSAIDWMPATNDRFSQAWYLLSSVIPVGTILIVWASVVVVRKAGFIIFTAAAFAVRAVTP